VLTALAIVFLGVPLFVYIALWILIPDAPYALPERSTGTVA
jgi:hypothetical protein